MALPHESRNDARKRAWQEALANWKAGSVDQEDIAEEHVCVMIYDSYRGGWGKTIKLQVLYDSNMNIV